MKRLIETDEDSGFDGMIGEKICVFCGVFIYAGKLAGVNDDHIELVDPELVYETGSLCADGWKDAQNMPSPWRVMIAGIESWGKAKC